MYKQVLYNSPCLMYRVMYSEGLGILIHMNWQKKGYSWISANKKGKIPFYLDYAEKPSN